ncbi:uncharacterized protein PITG_04705 [Phytophthora infestans T30-4]|uniref:B box-type domain-containing protein n=1 Tax=Phytophthora infestans (strain T30-4) TaxID=403677 RepID=D0N1V1_PHYIT|nr:uncharacterized protein PITG_04705 [Phytophthora infestans T30-4]EEY68280.1 conserved hypothetical protein [Phytophthora infestans T30-4]|eukprot:XP_002905439.1 conserved hypothetical protein [Phytophthora infestans T30-4]
MPSEVPAQTVRAALSTTTDTTPSGSPTHAALVSNEQRTGQNNASTHELPNTPETERSASEGVATPTESEKGANGTQNTGNRDRIGTTEAAIKAQNGDIKATGQPKEQVSAATGQTEQKSVKKWFDVLPMVLQNFKAQDREQIRQLMLPRCELCKRGKVDKKAECQLDHVAYWCAECDLQLCKDCFEQIHSVPRTRGHRKLATEDAPGTCLGKSHWASNFQKVIFQMITARKRPPPVSNGSSADSVGVKRKRDVDVIVIDGSDDEKPDDSVMKSAQAKSTLANGNSGQQGGNTGNQQHSSTTRSGLSRSSELFCQLQVPLPPASINPPFQAPAGMMEPIPLSQAQTQATSTPLPSPDAVQTSAAYTASNTVDISSSMGWNGSASQCGAPAAMGNANGSAAYTSSVMSNGMSTTDGMWSTTSAISTDLVSASNVSTLLPLGGAVFAENALVDSLVDRYHEVNQNVANMERQTEQLTRHIAVATCQGPYVAGPIMALLSKLQPILEAARVRRDKLLIAMIIQSKDIMACVRVLRLAELGDVPQVPMISHRKCLQISTEINHHKTKLIELNQHLSETLTQSSAVSSSWESTFIRTTSTNIQMHEKSIKELKKAREVEFVRIVQFSLKIREGLKAAFQRTVDIQRQQQRQDFQQYG